MSATLWIGVALLLPLAAALVVLGRPRPAPVGLVPLVPLPALGAALLPPGSTVELPFLLLGTQLGLDAAAPLFLLLTALVWSAAGLFLAAGKRPNRRYLFCWFAALTGNLGLVVALDPITFYAFFALLTFAAYGLIAVGTEESRRAGRLYLVLALIGEAAILAGFLLLAAGAAGGMALAALYFGLGVKHGVLPVHVWLPVAHGTAPTASSAVLSGAIVKAGLLGWLRFFETGMPLPDVAGAVTAAGLAAAVLGAVLGLTQRKPKMLLGYSTVSQMGLATAAFGSAFAGSWALLPPLVGLLAFHHALVKGALFLGLGTAPTGAGYVRMGLLGLLALSLAAFPGSGGALVKAWLGEVGVDGRWLTFSSMVTALLMVRFIQLAREPQPHAQPAGGAFGLLAVTGLAGPWLLLWQVNSGSAVLVGKAVAPAGVLPLLAAGVVAAIAWGAAQRSRLTLPLLPPGDIVNLLPRLPPLPRDERGTVVEQHRLRVRTRRLAAWERRLRSLPVTGLLLFGLLLILAATLR